MGLFPQAKPGQSVSLLCGMEPWLLAATLSITQTQQRGKSYPSFPGNHRGDSIHTHRLKETNLDTVRNLFSIGEMSRLDCIACEAESKRKKPGLSVTWFAMKAWWLGFYPRKPGDKLDPVEYTCDPSSPEGESEPWTGEWAGSLRTS